MDNSMRKVKNAGILKIFSVICEHGEISRADLRRATGISLMTVGKAVDSLCESGLCREEKAVSDRAGRRAARVSPDDACFSLVFDLTSYDFKIYVINLSLGVEDTLSYSYNRDFYYEENLFIFLKSAGEHLFSKYNFARCIGVGAALPAETDRDGVVGDCRIPELCGVNVAEKIREGLGLPGCRVGYDVALSAVSNAETTRGLVCLITLADTAALALTYGGKPVGRGGNLSALRDDKGAPLTKPILAARTAATLTERLTGLLITANALTAPNAFVIESKKVKLSAADAVKITAEAETRGVILPEIIIANSTLPHAARGMAIMLRGIYAEKNFS